jgi:hypothetical protein
MGGCEPTPMELAIGRSCSHSTEGRFAASCRPPASPVNLPGSGRPCQRAEVAVAVDARRRYQRGEAVEQLQRRQEQRAVPARNGFAALVEQALGISSRSRSNANGGRAQWRNSRSRPARSAASMRTEPSTEKPPP